MSVLILNFFSCDKNLIDSYPSITLLNNDGAITSDTCVALGAKLKFNINAIADEYPLTNFLIRVSGDTIQNYFDTGMYVNQLIWESSFIKGFSPSEYWEFIVRDRQGYQGVTQIWVTTDTVSDFKPVVEYPGIMLGAQENNLTGSLYSLSDNKVYFYNEASLDSNLQKLIDLVYYYYGEDEHTLASPGANIEPEVFPANINTWEIRNTTYFIKTSLNLDDYYNTTNDSILIANYIEGEGKRKSKILSSDDIYVFKTAKDKLGILLVMEVSGDVAGYLKIKLKIQE